MNTSARLFASLLGLVIASTVSAQNLPKVVGQSTKALTVSGASMRAASATTSNVTRNITVAVEKATRAAAQTAQAARVNIPSATPLQAYQISQVRLQRVHVETPLWGAFPSQLQPIESQKQMLHNIFTITPQNGTQVPLGTGFVFARGEGKDLTLWGVTSGKVVRGLQPELTVTFHIGKNHFDFPARVVKMGAEGNVDIALIELPQEIAAVARPVIFAEKYKTRQQDQLFSYGFSHGRLHKTLRKVLDSHSDRIVADFPRLTAPAGDFSGGVVLNEEGKAVGIELGGLTTTEADEWVASANRLHGLYRVDLSRVSEIVPFSRLEDLFRELENEGSGARVMLFGGTRVGMLPHNEVIQSVTVFYKDGSHKVILKNPFLKSEDLSSLFDLTDAQTAKVIISRPDNTTYQYMIYIPERRATRMEMLTLP